jgi:hypothetical protein
MHPDVEKYFDEFEWNSLEQAKQHEEEEWYPHSSDEEYPYSDTECEDSEAETKEEQDVSTSIVRACSAK